MTNVILCQNILVCHKHEILLGYFCTTSPQVNWRHLRHRLLRMCMEDIWHWCHCDCKLWTHFLCPLHYQFWHIMSMISPCTISPPIIEKFPHRIGLLPSLRIIWDLPLHRPQSQWCGRPICQPTWLSFLQFHCLTYFVLRRKLESQK